MTFLSTHSAWQWALAFAVPVGIIALYFLRLRRKSLEVPSTMLWRKSIEDLHVNAFWQRLRRNILLLLQLLAVAGLIAALARPASNVMQTGRRSIFLIDNSASMSTRDGDPTRLDAAKRKASQIVDQMEAGDEAMVVTFANSARVVAAWTRDTSSLRRAIASIEQTSLGTRLDEAISIVSGVASGVDDGGDTSRPRLATKVYLVSDGKFAKTGEWPLADVSMEYIRMGQATDNVGLMALAVGSNASSGDKREVFTRVRNFGATAVAATVEFRLDGERVDLRRVELPPGGEQGVVFPLPGGPRKKLSVHVAPGGPFALDDDAFAALSVFERARILRIGPANPILDAVFDTDAVRSLAKVDSRPESEVDRDLSNAAYDLIVFDRCAPEVLPSANTWFLGSAPKSMAATMVDATNAAILDWKSSHPTLRFLNLDDVSIYAARAAAPDSAVQPLIETDRGAILFTVARGVYTDLVLGVPLIDANGKWQSDWPLKASFPLFVMNVVRTFGGARDEMASGSRAGESVTIRAPVEITQAIVRWPDGLTRSISPSAPGRFDLADTSQVGIYEIDTGVEKHHVAVNLFDESESSIGPAEQIDLGSQSAADGGQRFRARREWWKWLAVLALVILLVEWYVYNRRVHV